MNLDRLVFAFAGLMVLVSVALSTYVHPYWSLLTVFIGLNLIQASFTSVCPAALLFKKFGAKTGHAFK